MKAAIWLTINARQRRGSAASLISVSFRGSPNHVRRGRPVQLRDATVSRRPGQRPLPPPAGRNLRVDDDTPAAIAASG
ncbi:hypothetical protein Vau01_018600 [Virgisporangium aurantiacum]|uniref:Uncharacterized protein n=1 Tax=Virgisporangium aurantiacum TaxID=175570 RepID=A0A8J3YZ48_9ACTN|nr:hypothetical protein Vau01_018600 [Virgisporangium aurantiacum]